MKYKTQIVLQDEPSGDKLNQFEWIGANVVEWGADLNPDNREEKGRAWIRFNIRPETLREAKLVLKLEKFELHANYYDEQGVMQYSHTFMVKAEQQTAFWDETGKVEDATYHMGFMILDYYTFNLR